MFDTEPEGEARRFRLHFEGPLTHDHTVPAAALVHALQQLQRVVHLLAMADKGREVRQRARVTHDIERRFPLVCRIPESGGYSLPIDLGDTGHQLFENEAILALANKTRGVIQAVNDSDANELIILVPDSYFRKGVVSAFHSMQPPRRSGVFVSIEDWCGRKLLNGAGAQDRIRLLQVRAEPDNAATPAYVTGSLIEMKFQERRLALQLLGSGRAFEANYSDDFEPVLLDHPRDLIQVHGNVVFGTDGMPLSISDVDEVLDVDESPIEIRTITCNNNPIQAKNQCLTFTVSFDRNSQLYEATGPFDVVVGAETRPELESQLDAELGMLWQEYALAAPDDLNTAAQVLRNQLHKSFQDTSNAA